MWTGFCSSYCSAVSPIFSCRATLPNRHPFIESMEAKELLNKCMLNVDIPKGSRSRGTTCAGLPFRLQGQFCLASSS